MAQVFCILGALCLVYYIFLQGFGMDFAVIWLAAGGAGVLAGYVLYRSPAWTLGLPRWVKAGVCLTVFLGILIFAILEGLIISGMGGGQKGNLDYIIVLGAQVRGDHPSRALRKRIQTAADYLRENSSTVAVLSGGQGPGEDMTEAECMRRELTEMGISENRLMLEERSVSTWENLKFCAELAPVRERKTGLVTQNFHIYRSMKLAKSQKYADIYGIAAPSEWQYQPHFMVREAFALAKEKIVGNL